MKKLYKNIIDTSQEAVKKLYGKAIPVDYITIQATKKEFEGDCTIVCFPLTAFSKISPEKTAQQIGEYLKTKIPELAGFNVVKGFLNLTIQDTSWIQFLQDNYNNQDYGQFQGKDKTVMVEYSSPNTNKPLHLGHIRNNLLGYSISEILKAYGYQVIKANLINDRGIHICKSMLAWQRWGNGETPETSGMKGDHLVGKYYVRFDREYKSQIKDMISKGNTEKAAKQKAPIIQEAQDMLHQWEAGDKEIRDLWKKMNGWVYKGFEATYKKLGVGFDVNYYESDTYLLGKEIVKEGLDKKLFEKREDGSVWVNLSDAGLDEKLLIRADGTSVYMTQDIGTAQLKYDDHKMDQSIYVVGSEQEYHFKVLKLILEKLSKPYAKGIYHLSYGMVDLPSGKMKSREGTVVDADDLIEDMIKRAEKQTRESGKIASFTGKEAEGLYYKIGMAALKFYLLKVDPKKGILFNPEESIDILGHTGPFIQYTYARIQSILRKWDERKEELPGNAGYDRLHPAERAMLLTVYRFQDIIRDAAETYNPAVAANYAYELAKVYNQFYAEVPVLNETEVRSMIFRVKLSVFTANVLASSMQLLGIDMPERM